MTQERSLRCRCGAVRAVASMSAQTGNRIVCYCEDCRAFAHFLKRPDLLDAAGGSDIFQMAPACIKITQGQESLRAMRLSPTGMVRFYTACCNTPVGNTINGHIPFVGLALALDESDERTRDQLFGPALLVMARSAIGPLPAGAHAKVPIGFLLRSIGLVLRWKLTGQGSPSPFFDAKYQPTVSLHVLNDAERSALRPATMPNAAGSPS